MAEVDRANGRRPNGLLDAFHPAMRSAPRPDPEHFGFDLDRTLASVVLLSAQVPDDAFTAHSLGDEREGAAIVISDDGLALTIGYLIVEAEDVTLTLSDGREVAADAAAYDHETGFGLVRAREELETPPLPLGRSADVRVGDEVVVGSYGGVRHAIAGRVVSRREFCGSWEYMLDESLFSAPLHPFWGGAALISLAGELIGVGSLYVEDSTGNNTSLPGNMFVPIDLWRGIADDMIETGRARREPRPWLGLQAVEVEDRLVVSGVAADGPAGAAGIRLADIILTINSQPVNTLSDMYRTLWSLGPAGIELSLSVLRDEDVTDVRVYSGDRYEFLKLPQRL